MEESQLGNTRPDSFITPKEQKELIDGWKNGISIEDSRKTSGYCINRCEGMGDYRGPAQWSTSIDTLHAESFIGNIAKLIKKRENDPELSSKKIQVLDVGGGIGVYAEQLRGIFNDKIKVTTTGLSPSSASKIRDNFSDQNVETGWSLPSWQISKKMHPDDLVCQSILQMSNYPEFDLIIDTFGEQYYIDERFIEKYINAVICKLKPGGMASIAPLKCIEKIKNMKNELESKYQVEMNLTNSISPYNERLEKIAKQIYSTDPNNIEELGRLYDKSDDIKYFCDDDKEDFLKTPSLFAKFMIQTLEPLDYFGSDVLKITKMSDDNSKEQVA